MAVIYITWQNEEKLNSFIFKTYSKNDVSLERCDNDLYPGVLGSILKDYVKQNIKVPDFFQKVQYGSLRPGGEDIVRYMSKEELDVDFHFFYYENNSKVDSVLWECLLQ